MDHVRQCTLRIYLVAGLSFLLLASTFYFIGFNPLLERLRAEHVREIDHSIDSGLWLLQGVLEKHIGLALQSANRTAIRKKQIAYLTAEVSFEELVTFSGPKLMDVLVTTEEISGITRYGPSGRLLVSVGQAVPAKLAKKCWSDKLMDVRLLGLVEINAKHYLMYCSPIDDRISGRVGVDILIIDDAEIWRIIDDLAGPEAIATFGISDGNNQIIYWPKFLQDSPSQGALTKYLDSRQIDPDYIIELRDLRQGVFRLFAVVDQGFFYADINHQFRVLLLISLLVTAVIFGLTVLVLRPVIRTMLSVEQLTESVHRDGLTGLYNHQYMQELLDIELARIERNGKNISLMMIDIDNFKRLNDDYGHQAGDQVLREISRVFSDITRKTDYFARYGGEEFMLILPETDHSIALLLAERVRVKVAEMEVKSPAGLLRLTISIGVVSATGGKMVCAKHQIIEAADRALYQSKNDGRNRVTGVEIDIS